MNKLKTISTYFIFVMAIFIMVFGLWVNDTWEVLAGFWMMMYVTERVSNPNL